VDGYRGVPRNESTMVTLLRVVHTKLSAEGWAIDTHVRHVRCFRLMVQTPWGNSPGVFKRQRVSSGNGNTGAAAACFCIAHFWWLAGTKTADIILINIGKS